jgi:hypothetical protein
MPSDAFPVSKPIVEQVGSPKEKMGDLLDDLLEEVLGLQQTKEAQSNPELMEKLKKIASGMSEAQTLQEKL